ARGRERRTCSHADEGRGGRRIAYEVQFALLDKGVARERVFRVVEFDDTSAQDARSSRTTDALSSERKGLARRVAKGHARTTYRLGDGDVEGRGSVVECRAIAIFKFGVAEVVPVTVPERSTGTAPFVAAVATPNQILC